MSNCCGGDSNNDDSKNLEDQSDSCCDSGSKTFDWLLWGSLSVVAVAYLLMLIGVAMPGPVHVFSHAVYELMNSMALGLFIGIIMVSVLSYVPRELVVSIMGSRGGFGGLVRATAAGVLLDLCSHGILMVGAKLYERGVSIGQVMAFLIASPWNSLSLTIILVALIGLWWTLAFIVLSIIIAIITGAIFNWCVARKILPTNSNTVDLPEDYHYSHSLKSLYQGVDFRANAILSFLKNGLSESRMVIRWLLFGVILASLIRTFVPEDYFANYFGPTLLGLSITLVAATVLEICSEGSTPIAADIFNRAGAPGNAFTFLMAGVSTDYTEVMVLKERTRSWKIALFLPLITLPQVLVLGFILNQL